MQNRIYQYTLSPIINLTTYIKENVVEVCIKMAYFGLATMEEFLLGKKEPFNFHKKLKHLELEAKWSKFAIRTIGFTHEHYAYLIPTAAMLEQIIAIADDKPTGRDGYQIFNQLVQGEILSNTHPNSVKDHKDLFASMSLNTNRYLKELTALCEETFPCHSFNQGVPKDKIEKVLYRLFAKMMFDLNLDDDQINIIKRIIEYSLHNTGNPFSYITSFFSSQFHQIHHEYHDMMNTLFQSKVKAIKCWLKNYKNTRDQNNNFFLKKIVDLIKESNPELTKIQLLEYINKISDKELSQYLKNSQIIRLPLILAGLSNLVNVCHYVITHLYSSVDPILLHELSEYLLHDNMNVSRLKKLHILCLQGLNNSTTPYIIRYFSELTRIGNIDIPAHTTVFISLKSEETKITSDITIPRKFPFIPFSIEERACPARALVLPVVKHITLHLAKQSPNVLSKTLFKIIDKKQSILLKEYAEMKIDLNDQDKFGDTLLHHAIRNNDVESVKVLIHYGADLTISNHSGYSPLSLAKYFQRKTCMELLDPWPITAYNLTQ